MADPEPGEGPPPGRTGPPRPPLHDAREVPSGPFQTLRDLPAAPDLAEFLVDTVGEGLLVLDLDLRVQAANEPFYQAFALKPEETLGRPLYDLGDRQWNIPELRELLEGLVPHRRPLNGYEVARDFEGVGHRTLRLNARRLDGHDLILLAIEDVSEPRERERALRETEESFRLLVENAREYAVFAMDEETRITMWSPGAERILGWTREEALGQTGAIIFTAEDRAAGVPEREIGAARAEGSAPDERWHVRKDGSRFWATGAMVALRDEAGVHGFAKILRDNTHQKAAEDALRESEERYRTLFNSIDEGFCVLEVLFDDGDPVDYRFLEANPSFERQTGLTDAIGRTASELVPDLERHWIETYGRVAVTGEPARFEQGSEAMGRWFDVYAFRIGAPELRHVALLFSDVTERRGVEQVRLESEARYRALFAQAPAFIAVLRGPEHVFEFVNPAYLRLVGERDLLGKPVREALPELAGQGLLEILDGVYRDGKPFMAVERPVLLQRTPNRSAEQRYADFLYQPLRDPDGSVGGVIALGVDVTDRVVTREERDRVQRELERANLGLERRVEARTRQVRRLSRALTLAEQAERQRIAHVLHEDLQQVIFAAKMVASLGDPDRLQSILDRALSLTRTLSHELSPPLLQDEDVEDLLRWVAEQAREQHALEVEVEVGEGIPTVEPTLRVLLYQLVRELLFNVVKHAGTKRARVSAARVDGHVRVVVADEGAGFDPATLEEGAEGGLGLPSVRERLELVGGRLTVESAPGQGTLIAVTVPVGPE
jgi:PAS domain S-box-containing protein